MSRVMRILVIRHAIAEPSDEFARTGLDDRLRPTTSRGRDRMRRAAAGLASVVPRIDRLASSTLVRATQTAEIVAAQYPSARRSMTESLDPEAPGATFLEWLRPVQRSEVVAIVGHQPHLGELILWLMTGRASGSVELRKGGAALLEFLGAPAAGGARLLWLMLPRQLRALRSR
jgi:phosphohistidine phosphatase